jgi:hypothetical protein
MADNFYGGYQYPFRDYSQVLGRIGADLGNALGGKEEENPLWTWNKDTGQYYNKVSKEAPQVPAGYKPTAELKPPPAAIMTRHNEATRDIASINNTLQLLGEAETLLGTDEKGIYEGITGPAQTVASTKLNMGGIIEKGEDLVNDALGTNFDFVNKDKGVKTSRFQQIMEGESLTLLSKQLKGPTAVQEVMTYKQIVADPTKTNTERANALRGMISVIKNDLAAQGKTIQNMERVYPALAEGAEAAAPDAGMDISQDPDQLRAWAQEAIDQGADPAQVKQMLEEYGVE